MRDDGIIYGVALPDSQQSVPNPCIDKPFDLDTLNRVISNRNPLERRRHQVGQ